MFCIYLAETEGWLAPPAPPENTGLHKSLSHYFQPADDSKAHLLQRRVAILTETTYPALVLLASEKLREVGGLFPFNYLVGGGGGMEWIRN